MTKENLPETVNSFLALMPTSGKTEVVIQCTESRMGEEFFEPFTGVKITGIALLRYGNIDVVALTTDDERAIAMVANRGGFIAVEKGDGRDGTKDANLAFRKDISHTRLNLVASYGAGVDVTYKDISYVSGAVVDVDPAAIFAAATLTDVVVIESVKPTWYTEDWMTVSSPNGESITIRADRNQLLGAMAINQKEMNVLNFGEEHIENLSLGQPPLGSIPAQIT